jgi:hypothetical protein
MSRSCRDIRLDRDRIAGRPAWRAHVALRRVVERNGLERLRARDDDIRHAIDRGYAGIAAEVGVHALRRAYPHDESGTVRIHGRRAHVGVPPVVGREQRERTREGAALHRLARKRRGCGYREGDQDRCMNAGSHLK